jgi:hypothetical protein
MMSAKNVAFEVVDVVTHDDQCRTRFQVSLDFEKDDTDGIVAAVQFATMLLTHKIDLHDVVMSASKSPMLVPIPRHAAPSESEEASPPAAEPKRRGRPPKSAKPDEDKHDDAPATPAIAAPENKAETISALQSAINAVQKGEVAAADVSITGRTYTASATISATPAPLPTTPTPAHVAPAVEPPPTEDLTSDDSEDADAALVPAVVGSNEGRPATLRTVLTYLLNTPGISTYKNKERTKAWCLAYHDRVPCLAEAPDLPNRLDRAIALVFTG